MCSIAIAKMSQPPRAACGWEAASVGAVGTASLRHRGRQAQSRIESEWQVPVDDGARAGVGLGVAGAVYKLGCQPLWRRRRAQHVITKHSRHVKGAVGVADSIALVPRVDRLHAAHHRHGVTVTGGAVGKVDVLAERHVGKAELASQRRPVGQAAPEDDLARPGHLVHLELRKRGHRRKLQSRELRVAPHNRCDLRADTLGFVEVVIVPVQNDVAAGGVHCCGALLANRGVLWQREEPHG